MKNAVSLRMQTAAEMLPIGPKSKKRQLPPSQDPCRRQGVSRRSCAASVRQPDSRQYITTAPIIEVQNKDGKHEDESILEKTRLYPYVSHEGPSQPSGTAYVIKPKTNQEAAADCQNSSVIGFGKKASSAIQAG